METAIVESSNIVEGTMTKTRGAELWRDLSALSSNPKLSQDQRNRQIRLTFMK
jgi:hypothetical protein